MIQNFTSSEVSRQVWELHDKIRLTEMQIGWLENNNLRRRIYINDLLGKNETVAQTPYRPDGGIFDFVKMVQAILPMCREDSSLDEIRLLVCVKHKLNQFERKKIGHACNVLVKAGLLKRSEKGYAKI